MKSVWSELEGEAEAQGLRLRGGFAVRPEDGVPALPAGRAAATLVLLGAIGGSLWPAFSRSPELADGAADPLDRWSRRVLEALAERFGAAVLFPFGGPPYLPFQRWAARAEPVAPSPLGLFIHPRYGLWHSYRGALAFAEALDLPPREAAPSPCETCTAKPCLSTCPVGAFTGSGYAVQSCVAHLELAAGRACMLSACLARRACPVAPDLAYEAAQADFHMRAFLDARRGAAE
ncbi:MAG TPA: ferredoxin [Kiloniellales bacterium]|nr:ferredoxin [Kiloniellales bacterium]